MNLSCNESLFVAGAIFGATEQKRIGIEKACEWLEKHTLREFLPQATIDRFRKEMEE